MAGWQCASFRAGDGRTAREGRNQAIPAEIIGRMPKSTKAGWNEYRSTSRPVNKMKIIAPNPEPMPAKSPIEAAVSLGNTSGSTQLLAGAPGRSGIGKKAMRAISVSLGSVVLLLSALALSQTVPPLISPDVHADRSVTFRLRAPHAEHVTFELEGADPVAMGRDSQGVWSVTTKPLAPQYYGYIFRSDDEPVMDPKNPLLWPNLELNRNMVHVPGPPSLPWEVSVGPHGVVHRHPYKSEIVGDQRDFYVYTPPRYDPLSKIEYPVLYLLHGYGQKSSSWDDIGLANVILDNLINGGRAKPMIVVMPLAYGGWDILTGGHSAFWDDELRTKNFHKFADALLSEVIPRVEKNYRVKKDRDSRAIAGLSMGGAEALLTGLNHLDQFSWVGSFSSGGLRDNFDQEFPAFNTSSHPKLHLLWVACGTGDTLIGINREFDRWLTSKGIAHSAFETPDRHTWMVWRRNLASFAPLLFR